MINMRKLFRRDQDTALPNAQRPPHLTAEQLEAMLRPSPYRRQASKHLDACTSCREEVENLSDLFNRFRTTSKLYAEQEQTRCEVEAGSNTGRSRSAAPHWRWSIAASALACALVAIPILRFGPQDSAMPRQGAKSVVPTRIAEMSDEAVLEGVQQDLATSVPAPLRVLAATSSSKSNAVTSGGVLSASRESTAVRASQ